MEFYLKEKRYDSAQELTAELRSGEVPVFRSLGRIGQAVVLAFQDQTAKSNQAFLALVNEPKPFVDNMRRIKAIQALITDALDRNLKRATDEDPFPRKLERLRHPQVPPNNKSQPGKTNATGP